MPPKVALVSHVYVEKGSRSKLRYIADQIDLTLITPDYFPFAYGLCKTTFSDGCNYRVKIYPSYYPLGIRTSTRWVLATSDMEFRSWKPDIIHVENEDTSFSLMQALLYRRLYAPSAKVVVFVWANMRTPGLKGISLRYLASRMRSSVDFFIAGNEDAKLLLIEYGVSQEDIAVIPLVGLNLDEYQLKTDAERLSLRKQYDIREDDFVVGFVGRLAEAKGVPELLQAFRIVQKQSKKKVRLLCIGKGHLKESLLDGQPDIVVISPGGAKDVLPYYSMMDSMVLPSRTVRQWKEQFGLVLTEAMASGVPVIGSNSGAIPEVIGDCGLVFPEGEVDELAKAIGRLIENSSLRGDLAIRARERVKAYFSDKQIAMRTISVYEGLLSQTERGKS